MSYLNRATCLLICAAMLVVCLGCEDPPPEIPNNINKMPTGKLFKPFVQGETEDARVALEESLEVAKKDGKPLFILFKEEGHGEQARYGWMLENSADLFSKYFCFLQIHCDSKMDNGRELMREMAPNGRGGNPFTMILDAEGEVLAHSIWKERRNIGYPRSKDTADFFMELIKKSCDPSEADLKEMEKVVTACAKRWGGSIYDLPLEPEKKEDPQEEGAEDGGDSEGEDSEGQQDGADEQSDNDAGNDN
ncbi:MAG: hypothetical protein AAF939_16125 [Planctomycetota bacterium]